VPPVKVVNQLKVPETAAVAESVTVPDPQRGCRAPMVGGRPETMEAVTGVRGVLSPQIPLSNVI
jgi:hypothetical protein